MPIAYRYTKPDAFFHGAVLYNKVQPGNSTLNAPPPKPWPKQWPQYVDGTGWVMVDDHRERKPPLFDAALEQDATDYWLPGDTHASPARQMKEPGPLPDGAMLSKPTAPEPTIEELFDRLRNERDVRISTVLWMRERHADELELGKETTLTPEQYTALLTYIQALRDLPAQPGAPWDGGGELTPWPELPSVG